MSDRFYGEIDFPSCALDNEEIAAEVASFTSLGILQGVSYHKGGSGSPPVVTLGYENAPNGEFPELEELLISKGFPFNRQSSAYFEIPAERRLYRPAAEDQPEVDTTFHTSEDGCRYVYTDDLRRLLNLSTEECQEKLRQILDEADPQVISIADWVRKDRPKIAMLNNVERATVDDLHALTGQESGLIVHEDGLVILCNWSSYRGLPHSSSLGLVDMPTEIPQVEGWPVDNWMTLVQGLEIEKHLSARPDEVSDGPAMVYEIDRDVLVIAPKGWN